MTRTVRLMAAFLATFATSTLVMPEIAEAASKEEMKAAKTQVKAVGKELKSFQKLNAKWEKAIDKGKDPASIEADIMGIVKDQLGMLRKKGVASTAQAGEEGKDEWVERYRNALVAVRDAKAEGRKRNQMAEVEKFMSTRVERAQKRLDGME